MKRRDLLKGGAGLSFAATGVNTASASELFGTPASVSEPDFVDHKLRDAVNISLANIGAPADVRTHLASFA